MSELINFEDGITCIDIRTSIYIKEMPLRFHVTEMVPGSSR